MKDKLTFFTLLCFEIYFGIGESRCVLIVACSNALYHTCAVVTTISSCVPIAPGPWYVAEVLTGSYGFIGAHGVYVSGHFLPGSMTYLYGTLQVSFSTMQDL